MARARRRWLWLVVAAVLLALGAALMLSADPPPPAPIAVVAVPRKITPVEQARNNRRRSWVPTPSPDAGPAPRAPPRPRDPLMAALPSEVKRGAVVVEANAIRNSELGDLLVDCLFAGEENRLPELRDAGLDPLTQVDRLAVADDTLIITGDFSKTRLDEFAGPFAARTDYGPKAELLEPLPKDGRTPPWIGVWDRQMLVFARDAEGLKVVLDRLDGSGPSRPAVLSEDQAWGEIYGVIEGKMLANVLKKDERLRDVIRATASRVELHADVSHDVGLSAEVVGEDPAKTEQLRRALGSALSLARLELQAKGKTDQAQVLEAARVRSAEGGARFKVEAGLPYEFLERVLKQCSEDGRALAARRRADRAGAPDAQ